MVGERLELGGADLVEQERELDLGEREPLREPFDLQALAEVSFVAERRRRVEARGFVLPCLLYTSPSPRDGLLSRMPSSA